MLPFIDSRLSSALQKGRPRVATRVLAVAVLTCAAATANAATQAELESRVQTLTDELAALKAEVDALKHGRATPGAQSGAPANAVAANGAMPTSQTAAVPAPAVPIGTIEQGISFFGYGELNYQHPVHDAAASTFDLARWVLGVGYRFDDRTRFVSELEIEHGVSSADDPGEVEIEQAYIERELTPGMFAKAGLILIPSGMLNENHEPTRYYGVFRNFVETAIIPSTWREGGVVLQGNTVSGLRWDIGVTTGFNLGKFDPTDPEVQESPLGSIHQELALAKARDLSAFGAVNYTGIPGLRIGASIFSGGASQGDPGLPSSNITLWEGHVRWTPGAFDLSALYAHGQISDTQRINLTLVGNRYLIPESFFGWYAQAAWRAIDRDSWALAPFVRYERFNTASSFADVGTGLTPFALDDRKVWTGGLNLMLGSSIVLKADYLDFRNESALNRFDLGLGYQF